jgi:hypothetical protein
MVDLQQLHNKFKNNDLVFSGINTVDDPAVDNLKSFLRGFGKVV